MRWNWSRLWRLVISLVLIAICVGVQPEGSAASMQPPAESSSPRGVATGFLSIPPAAFHPRESDYDYENYGRYLIHHNDPTSDNGDYYAAVFLPHGTTLTALTFFYHDFWTANGATLSLIRVGNLIDSGTTLTSRTTSDSSACDYSETTTFSDPAVDNFNYIYFLKFAVSDSSNPATENVKLCGALIQYEYSLPFASPSYLNIPAGTFIPYSDGSDFINQGSTLQYYNPSGSHDFQAPVFLPHGSIVEGATLYYGDWSDPLNGEAHLCKTDLANGWPCLADLFTQGYEGNNMYHSELSPYATIDNQNFGYWAFFRLPQTGTVSPVRGKSINIRYLPPASDPLVNYIVVPAAAFIPMEDGYDYENHGRYLKHVTGPNNFYVAPVHLPQGKHVQRMTFYFNQISNSPASVMLNWNAYDGDVYTIAHLDSLGSGWTSRSTTDMHGADAIDNYWNTYWLQMSADNYLSVWPAAVVLEVSDYLVYLPILRK